LDPRPAAISPNAGKRHDILENYVFAQHLVAAATNHFDDLLRRLGNDKAARVTHTEVAALLIDQEGREALRLAFQRHLFGEVTVTRVAYNYPGARRCSRSAPS
jgi:hypothetical protein